MIVCSLFLIQDRNEGLNVSLSRASFHPAWWTHRMNTDRFKGSVFGKWRDLIQHTRLPRAGGSRPWLCSTSQASICGEACEKRTFNWIIKNEAEIAQRGHGASSETGRRCVWINHLLRTQQNLCRGGKWDGKPREKWKCWHFALYYTLMFSLF